MSSFAALNLSNNDNVDESKDHSRELQVEESSKVFQLALLQLKAKRFEDAKETFNRLFEIDVIRPNKWGVYEYSSPTLDSLRYLAYRNRGILYYQYVKENYKQMESGDIVDNILKTLECLLESLQHSDADNTVTHLLLNIFWSFNSTKLSRSILEYELTRSPEEIRLLSSLSAMFKDQKRVFKQYSRLLENLHDASRPHNIPKAVEDILKYIENCNVEEGQVEPLLKDIKAMKVEDDELVRDLDGNNINLNELSWEELGVSLRSLVPRTKVVNVLGRKSDTYSDLEAPIEFVSFSTDDLMEKLDDSSNESPGQSPEHFEDAVSVMPEPNTEIREERESTVKRPESTDRPQRSSKRFKEKEKVQDPIVEEQVSFHTHILDEINQVFRASQIEQQISIEEIDPNYTEKKPELCVSDFYDCLTSWTNKHTEFLKQGQENFSVKGSTDDFTQLTILLRSSMFSGDVEPTEALSEIEAEDVKQFILTVNDKKLHFHAVRFLFIEKLLKLRYSGVCLITDYFWSPALYEVVEFFSIGMESNLYQMIEPSTDETIVSIAVSIFEIMTNLMGTICNDIANKKAQGQKYNELESQRNKLERKVNRWYEMIWSKNLPPKLSLRFHWSHFSYLQCTTDVTNNNLITTIEEIEKDLAKYPDFGTVAYSNYTNISSLSLKTVQSQFSKIKMLRRFTIVDIENEEEDTTHKDYIEHLYCILNEIPCHGSDFESMQDFVNTSPFLMKLKLWKMLINYFAGRKDQIRFQNCFFSSIKFLFARLSSEEYQVQSQLQRQQTLLSTITHIGEFSKRFYQVLCDSWNMSLMNPDMNQLQTLIAIFRLLYCLVFYETLTEKDSSLKSFFKKAVKSSNTLQDIFLAVSSLLILCHRYVTLEHVTAGNERIDNVIRLISTLHMLAGKFEFCDKLDGNFLKVQEKVLCEFLNQSAFTHLKRVLWCRYHISIGLDNPEDQHDTVAQPMEKVDAIMLSNYFIKFQYSDRNILVSSNNRSNFKQFFENVMELIGDIDYEANHVLSRNEYFFNRYFTAPITLKTIRDAYAGELEIEFTSPNDDLQSGVNGGLFYVSAVHALNQYKSRKKSMQARPSELDAIISTLTTDILYNTKRFESWYLLGKCYSFVVEDDLTWTSDKLASRDKKQATAVAEKKAILCYLMALSHYLQTSNIQTPEQMKDDNTSIFRNLLESLGKEMLQAYVKPMSNMSYTWKPEPVLVLKEDGSLENLPINYKPSISETNIRRCILMILAKADTLYIQDEKRTWSNPFYISKVYFKTGRALFKERGICLLQDSCRLALKQSSVSGNDAVLEPHYFLVSSCYKCFKDSTFSFEDALSQLKQDNGFFGLSDDEWQIDDEKSFFELIIKLLKYILSKDKQKWQHRPVYRIAQIKYSEFQDTEGAMEEMNKLLALKSVNKNVVNIWKPEHELPGKHFVYAYQYVLFYMDLLNEKHDFMAIGGMVKKLRRFGSGMINSQDAINKAVELFVNGAKIKLSLNEKEHGELLMQRIPFPEFVELSEELFQVFKRDDYDSEVLDVFSLAYNLKKGTNSIQFDGVCITIYFKYFYCPFVENKKQLTPYPISTPEVSNGIQREKSNSEQPQPQSLTELPRSPSPASTTNKDKIAKTTIKNPTSVRKRVSKRDVFDRVIKLIEKRLS
ncbi:unnamed protein product [Kluyveromyces dobzhanskii CBS 2104]|uniref:WGS project CCBQ000000000 data, contig 00016 n=1 Tax=Kluyveromyces dobzhanskii CBS 2104 TaxID=1427455 RepID=A0A0A8L1S8_9SACH|nr:unnamed protein product [Kluyveromyces dobzhanskii CBS 2104]